MMKTQAEYRTSGVRTKRRYICRAPTVHPSLFSPPIINLLSFWPRWVFIAACRLSLVEVLRLLVVVASLAVEHGLYSEQASAVSAHRLSNGGSWILELRLSHGSQA